MRNNLNLTRLRKEIGDNRLCAKLRARQQRTELRSLVYKEDRQLVPFTFRFYTYYYIVKIHIYTGVLITP